MNKKMKKHLHIPKRWCLTALTLLSLLLPAQVSAQYWKNARADFSVADPVSKVTCYYKYTYNEASCKNLDGNVCLTAVGANSTEAANLTEFTIPSSVTYSGTTYSVVAVGAYSSSTIYNKKDISAFNYCKSLTKLTIPASIKQLELAYTNQSLDYNFSMTSDCVLTEFVVDEDNTAYCSVNGVVFNKAKTMLVAYPTYKIDSNDSTYTVPEGTKVIGNGAFFASKLKKVILPTGITSIKMRAFRQCAELKDITLPSTLAEIGMQAFMMCHSLPTINLPTSLTSIGASAFAECDSLDNITWPSSVVGISNAVFKSCYSLKNITLPNTLETIWANAFLYCRSLPGINLKDCNSLQDIRTGAFSSCHNLNNIEIPSSVTSIGDYAFGFCSSLEKFNIPAGCTLGHGVFINTPRLKTITVDPANKRYTFYKDDEVKQGILYGNSGSNEEKDELIYFIPSNDIGAGNKDMIRQFIVPDHVKKICAGSMGIHNIESLILPSDLEEIEQYAFARFWRVVNPDNDYVTYSDADKKVLEWSMTEITIPAKVTTLYLSSFLQQRIVSNSNSYTQSPSTMFKNIFLMGVPTTIRMGNYTSSSSTVYDETIPIGDNTGFTDGSIFKHQNNNEVLDVVKVFVKKSNYDNTVFTTLKTRIGDRFGYKIPLDDRLTEAGKVITMCRDFDCYFPDAQSAKAYIATGIDETKESQGIIEYKMEKWNYHPSRTGDKADGYQGMIVRRESGDTEPYYQIGELDYSNGGDYNGKSQFPTDGTKLRVQMHGNYGEDGSFMANMDEAMDGLDVNRLVGVVANSHVQGNDDTYTNWGLSSGKWQQIVNTGRLTPYNRAYLHITPEEMNRIKGATGSSNAKISMTFIDDNGTTTGINTINNEQLTINNSGWFTLDGRRLDTMPTQKGIYIHNGRKEVVR